MNKILFLSLCILAGFTVCGQEKITIRTRPEPVYIEQGETSQFLNADFIVQNHSADTLVLSRLAVSVYDTAGRLVHTRFLDDNGTAPSIQTLPLRRFPGSASGLVFNPFSEFSAGLSLAKLDYEWTFSNRNEETFTVRTTISPRPYVQPVSCTFPLKGRVLVYDGHDFYAHHRRFDYEFAPIKQLGITANFMRYAYDLVVVDSASRVLSGDPQKDDSYYGLGKPVYAVADGRVVYAFHSHKDDKTFSIPALADNPLELYGNCLAVQHNDSTISIYGHLQQNSLKVRVGDRVSGGQEIAAIGVSGSSFFPHLHFEMRTSIKSSAEGLPSYFSNLYLLEGEERKLRTGLPETGNILLVR